MQQNNTVYACIMYIEHCTIFHIVQYTMYNIRVHCTVGCNRRPAKIKKLFNQALLFFGGDN